MNYTIKEIADITNSEVIGNGEIKIKNIAFDSRTIYSTKHTAFIAINTKKNSGQKYIDSVIDKGIDTIITENKIENPSINQIITENSVQFLQTLAKYHFEHSDINSIGITGSNGKTILKEWLYQCLSNEFVTVKSPKSFNSQIGLPLSLLQIDKKHELGIFEVGISKPDEMQNQEHIFHPKIGLLTHIGSAHSANFSSEEELINEKLKLFKNSEIIFYNADNLLTYKTINQLYSSKKVVSYGLEISNDIHIISDVNNRTQDIQIKYFDEIITLPIFQRDEATLTNVLALIGILKELKISNSDIKEKIDALKAIEMRLESIEGTRNNLIINDSYNLDLDSLKIAFQFIGEYNKPKKSLILTDILDSNENSQELYSEVAELVNEQKFDKVFLIGDEISNFHEVFTSETYTFNNTNQFIDSKVINEIENQVILLKGARKFEIEKIKEILELRKHDTVLEINLNAILHNINFHKSLLKPETKMMAMVKANAYGLGSYEISEFLQHHHIDYLGVAFVDEGVELRKKGITTPIIVMNPEQHSYDAVIEYNLEPEIYSLRVLELFNDQLIRSGNQQKYPIHIKLETGMHRLGFKDFELDELTEKLNTMNVKVQSIFSHLSSSDVPEEKEFTLNQIETFEKNSSYLINQLGYKPLRHILNSAGITNYSDYQYDMVRIGIGMIGETSNRSIKSQLQNSVSFKTVVSQISEVKTGESVGYSRKYKAEHDTKIATIPVGYADGIPRLVGNKVGNVGINKKLCPIVGNVCMDMMMINVENVNVKEGDPVVIFNSNPTLEEFSKYCQTITYEVLTSISPRVKRIYIKN
ncbi:bifunctional UDP-N-acetylmuramoyl-tripeptide:D-alanyl-D-alanine ligase/alanine racemase [Epilithonimonas ginsengisoli]|uniref:Alanine racemase n=1 Tax=Epilithonimonas ginsengisoli TaxID=1245592 RepID=A0ABU4JEA1_9FLAO|nr:MULTISPECIES: bifunctional UDP-N-acetylmuramoyl-tripeptide:D-alanyl-D-alanine ligase/alanine racemase [Chryseobacterium group]MBV6879378.1 bifunctional UDP-N-acetylmuramoyl-tripeptide:D-alanyl-D-alanine ligase/alanine racemase [Epilithonimonas sp. FP105]MDW8547923.1 bifunctional UDP-N-acetylmuramoyl-tripeptide:D-alanyl-D-alanine ligase/alanine racemase [Epilithonimonas ginsengisoli]OAH73150.1 bifunctional UDP-N-acetylmuramoyl-tripeptide:D-alanyl-D-alanine ligase/alanine racemase [Chryseobacte